MELLSIVPAESSRKIRTLLSRTRFFVTDRGGRILPLYLKLAREPRPKGHTHTHKTRVPSRDGPGTPGRTRKEPWGLLSAPVYSPSAIPPKNRSLQTPNHGDRDRHHGRDRRHLDDAGFVGRIYPIRTSRIADFRACFDTCTKDTTNRSRPSLSIFAPDFLSHDEFSSLARLILPEACSSLLQHKNLSQMF